MIQNLESENYILGCMVIENGCIDIVREIIKPEHFSISQNQLLCKIIYQMYENKIPIDTISLYENSKNEISAITISKITENINSTANTRYHTAVIYEKYLRRNLLKLLEGLKTETLEESGDIFEQINEVKTKLDESLQGVSEKETHLYERLETVFRNIEKRMKEKTTSALTSIYFPSFNRFTAGLLPGEMLSLSGKDKAGKTTFAYRLALDFAINSQMPVGIFSYEMIEEVLDWKAIAMETGIDFMKLRNPHGFYNDPNSKLTKEEFEKTIAISARRFHGTKIYICDRVLNELQIKAKMKIWINNYGVKFFLIDYIGLIPTTRKFDNREREVSYLSRFFKQVTKEFRTNTLILSQQNRDGDIAESMGLQRDPDFAFTIQKPYDEEMQSIKINGDSFTMTENDFIVTLKRSRFGKQKKQFIVGYTSENKFMELDKTRGDGVPIYIKQEIPLLDFEDSF